MKTEIPAINISSIIPKDIGIAYIEDMKEYCSVIYEYFCSAKVFFNSENYYFYDVEVEDTLSKKYFILWYEKNRHRLVEQYDYYGGLLFYSRTKYSQNFHIPLEIHYIIDRENGLVESLDDTSSECSRLVVSSGHYLSEYNVRNKFLYSNLIKDYANRQVELNLFIRNYASFPVELMNNNMFYYFNYNPEEMSLHKNKVEKDLGVTKKKSC